MILIDTSAWIEFYHPRGDPSAQQAITEALEWAEVATLAPIMVELLSGVRDEGGYSTVEEDLTALIHLPIEERVGRRAAAWSWQLAREGRRVPTVDLLIAGAADVHDAEVWHFGDGHFATIAAVSDLAERSLAPT